MLALKILPYEEERARQRQLAAQNNHAARAVPANLPELVDKGDARDKAAQRTGASARNTSSEGARDEGH